MEISKKTIRRLTLAALLCIVVIWLLNETERFKVVYDFLASIFSPFAVGAGLAFVLNVPMRALENNMKFIKHRGLRRTLALVLTLVIIILIVTLVLWILIPQLYDTVQSLIESLPKFGSWVIDTVHGFLHNNQKLLDWFHDKVDLEGYDWSMLVNEGVEYLTNKLPSILDGAVSLVKTCEIFSTPLPEGGYERRHALR